MQRLSDTTKFITPSGDLFQDLYTSKVMKDGTIELTVTGKEDIKQKINSWKEHTDMSFVLRNMSAGLYPQREGAMYGDFTDMPETMADAMQLMIDAESRFYELPLDTRAKFDNDFRRWLVMANSDVESFSKLMGIVNDEPINEVEKGVEE